MAKNKANPVVTDSAAAADVFLSSDGEILPHVPGATFNSAIAAYNEGLLQKPAPRPRSAQWLATARGGLADQLRIVADQMTALATNPVLNTLTEDGISAVTEAIDTFCLLKEEIEAA